MRIQDFPPVRQRIAAAPLGFGICHYGKVYERNGSKRLRNKAFVKPIDKLPQ
jgi:hypothetical protein